MNYNRKLIHQYKQTLEGTKEEIFPLLCPVREKEWLAGWDYNMLYSESGYGEKGCIFETSNLYGTYHWIITKYDKSDFSIQFVKSLEHKLFVIIDINLESRSEKLTYCKIQYTFISTEDEMLEHMYKVDTEENFRAHMKVWEDSLNYYLKYGEMLIE